MNNNNDRIELPGVVCDECGGFGYQGGEMAGECHTCFTLGRIFSPGDFLTAIQAKLLTRYTATRVQERLRSVPHWNQFDRAVVNDETDKMFQFRVTPARQEAAAQIAEKEYYLNARIAVLESDNRDARSSRDDYANSLKGQKVANDNLRSVVDSQISRIAEKDAEIERLKKGKAQWKQMAELRLQEMKEVVSEYVQELTAAREREEKAKRLADAFMAWHQPGGGVEQWKELMDAQGAYDASRAEKKELGK